MSHRRSVAYALALSLLLFFTSVLALLPAGRSILEHYSFRPGVIEAIATSQTPIAFQGLIFQEKALTMPDILPVYGSSEFSAVSSFHPSKLFDGRPDAFMPFLIGRGGSQSLVHVLSLAAQGETLRGKKVAIILSPQWFDTKGITSQYLKQNFSALQTYQILYNPDLSETFKRELSLRLLQFPQVLKDDPTLQKNLLLSSQQDKESALRQAETLWRGQIEHWKLEVQDLYKTAAFVPLVHQDVITRNAAKTSTQILNWQKLQKSAEDEGAEATTNNSFGILNSYYTKEIIPRLAESKNSQSGSKLFPSPEYQDLQLLMKVLKEQGAQAMFVIVPVNGFWYDYTGFPAQERTAYYARVRQMITQNGFECADFSQHEYDQYFLQDIMHLGWKGWVYVDEALDQFYHQRP